MDMFDIINKHRLVKKAMPHHDPIEYKTKYKYRNKFLCGLEFIHGVEYYPKQLMRVYETPYIIRNVPVPSKVLDIGCRMSFLPIWFAVLGCDITGIDLKNYPLIHPNLKFIKGDFLKYDFKDEKFDCIYACSVVEHMGYNVYGGTFDELQDFKAIKKIYNLLKEKGI
ncbi:unnamed protein product, partial [marine sediment metagenome]